MARKKRAAARPPSDPPGGPAKKAKSNSLTSVGLIENTEAAKAESITARNLAESPLLRIPRELRDMIWEFAFGGETIHIEKEGTDGNSGLKRKYVLCETEKSFREVYDLTKAGPSSENAYQYAEEYVLKEPYRHNGCKNSVRTVPKVFRVCKQVYQESLFVLYGSNTFSFIHAEALKAFVLTPGLPRHLIKKLHVHIGQNFSYDTWGRILTPGFVALLSSLEELYITLMHYTLSVGDEAAYRHMKDNVDLDYTHNPKMWGKHLQPLRLVLSSFQQHALKSDRTTCVVIPTRGYYEPRYYGRLAFNIDDLRKLAEETRKILLLRRPPGRVSRRITEKLDQAS
ncbi:hypothetical protein K432DRAFT_430232 [Lepidopterella palustris CBS 459.81]|uniref:DUF7730 domain-containing protein n=1 Tax=Lepidopterella palustris CBS 459.81 TaxID=1314670 RepID=A0A8E2J973_9PEZI|nr:hypothetical protein K432DRAFT_430232 [Lepidopterella palustris CBS 459.81]